MTGCTPGWSGTRSASRSWTSPTAPSTARSDRCFSPPPRPDWCGSPSIVRATTLFSPSWPPPSARGCCGPRSPRPGGQPARAGFAGRRRVFAVAIDLQLARGFRRAVLGHLQAIPYGETQSATVARASGNPNVVRAAASVCVAQPRAAGHPGHRVVRTDGTIGGYRGASKPSTPSWPWSTPVEPTLGRRRPTRLPPHRRIGPGRRRGRRGRRCTHRLVLMAGEGHR